MSARSGDVDADVRDRRPGGDVPVDPADVVAGLVRADLGELRAAAEVVGAVLAGQEAADPPRRRSGRAPAGARPAWGPGPGARAATARAGRGGASVTRSRSVRGARRAAARAPAGSDPVEDHVRA